VSTSGLTTQIATYDSWGYRNFLKEIQKSFSSEFFFFRKFR